MTGICSTKKFRKTLIEKKDVFKEGQDEIVERKVVSVNEVNFKSGTLYQAKAKAFHIVLNLRISTAHSYNTDFIVTDNQFKKL